MSESSIASVGRNPLSKISLVLGALSAYSIVALALLSWLGTEQGWLPSGSILMMMAFGMCAFSGFLSMLLANASLVVEPGVRSISVLAISTGLLSLCLFLFMMALVG